METKKISFYLSPWQLGIQNEISLEMHSLDFNEKACIIE